MNPGFNSLRMFFRQNYCRSPDKAFISPGLFSRPIRCRPAFYPSEGGRHIQTQITYPVINLAETGRRIERQRRLAGLTVRDVQTYFGFEYPQAIYKWQNGQCLPTVDNLLALARLLKVSMEDLLAYDGQEPPERSEYRLPESRYPPPEAVQLFRAMAA